ncbi:vWA domain-containing protein [Aquabacterium sp.]|uniref:vWA domain-containing protein n=1 Tax=Aquabacterium sp. TaxID=1872578 RepID=UPI002B75274F|nr:vWA domain-containing protein [Aquabacterium sp.]HSW06974.1 vWA domain-containing protein [Aquabacterium sp.]
MNAYLSFAHPWLLGLLPLALLALLPGAAHELRNAVVALMPRDGVSSALQVGLRLVAVLALAGIVIGLAGPYRPAYTIERVGKGAEIVLVLDRSRSMDQGFAGGRAGAAAAPRGTGPEALDYYVRLGSARAREPKGRVARALLSEFAAKRADDRFGMVVFSTVPMRVLDFTQKQEVIQAAIAAGNVGRGLSETNIALALESALSFFEDRPYTGSRIVLLVSDGGDKLDPAARERIQELVRKHRVAIYWIYLRSVNSPGLTLETNEAPSNLDVVPEYMLHRYFESLGAPYRAYEAENPAALQKAIEDLNRLENLPIVYRDLVPRRDLSPHAHGLALLCVLLLLAANLLEIRRWA